MPGPDLRRRFGERLWKSRQRRAQDSAASNSRRSVLRCRAMRVVEKRQLLSAEEIGRTLQRLAHEIVEKSGGTKDLALPAIQAQLALDRKNPVKSFWKNFGREGAVGVPIAAGKEGTG